MHFRRILYCSAAALIATVALPANAGSGALDHLRDEYRGKTLVLRGFYSGDRLHYDASGAPADRPNAGEWMSDGLVQVNDIRTSHHHLIIEAERQLVIQFEGKEFALLREKVQQTDKRPLAIEADVDPQRTSPAEADAVMAKIFFTANDNLSSVVSDFWKPCLRDAVSAGSAQLRISSDLLLVPGVSGPAARGATAESGDNSSLNCAKPMRGRRGVHPTAIYQPNPEYSDRARRQKINGNVILMLVVNQEGLPENVRIQTPLGYGLDEKALAYVRTWRFQPAEVDGQPIAMSISVEVNFHLY